MIFYNEEDRPVASASSCFMETTPCLGTCSHARGDGNKKRATKNDIGPCGDFGACRHFLVARFSSPLLRAWGCVLKQGDVFVKPELAEVAGSSSFF